MGMFNTANQHQGIVAWSAVATNPAPPVDLRHHVGFSFTFNVKADILVDAVFEFAAAPADPANPCVPLLPQYKVQEVLTCAASWGAVPAGDTFVTIPAGTLAGAVCTATLPCKPDAFIQVEPASGDTGKIEVVITLSGPRT
jgi:hypothetical protein